MVERAVTATGEVADWAAAAMAAAAREAVGTAAVGTAAAVREAAVMEAAGTLARTRAVEGLGLHRCHAMLDAGHRERNSICTCL